jgi:hypothetical protein
VAGEPVDGQGRTAPGRFSRSATTVRALTIALAFHWAELLGAFARDALETLALERGEVGELACDPPEARALQWSELGEAFVRDAPETLALLRSELGEVFVRDAPETLALQRGEIGELACDRPEMRALPGGELGEAFVRDPLNALALERGEVGEFAPGPSTMLALDRAAPALTDAALVAIKSQRTQRRAAYGDGCCRQTNRYVTHHDDDTPSLYF